MGAKGSAPPPPNFGAIAVANRLAAKMARATAKEQLAWAKKVYKQDRADTQRVVNTLLPMMEEQAEWARGDRERYEEQYQPLEDKLVKEAEEYATPERAAQEAGRNVAMVDQQFENARQAAEQRLAGFGIDPSQVRAGALDLGTRLQEASAKAGAASAGRRTVEDVGRALRSEAINIGRGYPGQVAQSQAVAQQAGQGAVQSNLNTSLTGGQLMGTGVQWAGIQNQALGNWGDFESRIYSAQQQGRNSGGGIWQGLGTLAGAALGGAKPWFLAEGGEIPPEASPSGGAVEDDVPTMLTAGEFVVPRDVVMRKGTEFFEKLFAKTRGIDTKGQGAKARTKPAQAPSDSIDAGTIEQMLAAVMTPGRGAPAYG